MKKMNLIEAIKNNKILTIAILVLILITITTQYYGSTDINDYSDTAKFFAGKYSAKIRSSHSYFLGFIHFPFLKILNSFFIFKITSLIFLFLIIYSVYKINNKDKKALWIMIFLPIIWYMAPWINSIQLASLFLLWAYYFINKYDREHKLSNLFYSGILCGLGFAVWDTILYFSIILAICFLFNKKSYHSLVFIIALFIGLLPRLILDQVLFNFAFFTTLKTFLSGFANLFGGVYERTSGFVTKSFTNLLSVFLAIPIYFWILYKPEFFTKNRKTMFFLTLSIVLILTNPQIRYILAIAPIIAILLTKYLTNKQVIKQIAISIIIILLFISPYIIQINNSIDNKPYGVEFNYLLENKFSFKLNSEFPEEIIKQDLNQITESLPNKVFVVGNHPDYYQLLADLYWGDKIEEFVSIQDYNLYLNNETTIFEKKFSPIPSIQNRRQIWLAGGLDKNPNDKTDYENITLAISIDEPISLPGFIPVKKYNTLYVSQKQ